MMSKEKISIAMLRADLRDNGMSSVIINYCSQINLEKYDITIISGEPVSVICEEKIKNIGLKIKKIPSRKKNIFNFYYQLYLQLKKEKYDIIHIHGNSATITDQLFIAYICKIPVRIVHSHNVTCNHIFIHKIISPIFKKLYTKAFACSEMAGRWMCGSDDFTVIPNGFDTRKFCFNKTIRDYERKKLGLEGKFVLGNVARFNNQKNHPFLLKIFNEVAKVNKDAWLLLVGDGPDLKRIKALVEDHPYKDRIIFYGVTKDVEKVYNIFDVFVFPSLFEGFGIVLLEAQINGLPCIVSDVVPLDVKVTDNIEFISLNISEKIWADNIIKKGKSVVERQEIYSQYSKLITRFDMENNIKLLERIYDDLNNKYVK